MWQPVQLENPCKICNGPIIAKRKRDLGKEVCGRACAGRFYVAKAKVYVQCLHCKKEFLRTCRTQNKYCSKKCCAQTKVKVHKRRCARCKKEFTLQNIAYERIQVGHSINPSHPLYSQQVCNIHHRQQKNSEGPELSRHSSP